jgi:hypothetical protein
MLIWIINSKTVHAEGLSTSNVLNHLTFKECGKKGGYEEFEDPKGVIRIRISKKNRQHKEKVQKSNYLQ